MPDKSVKSIKHSKKASIHSHQLERKNSIEAKSILVENESGKVVHQKHSNTDLHEIAGPEMKEHLNSNISGSS
jgi:hypothetical protein